MSEYVQGLFIGQLKDEQQIKIENELIKLGLSKDDIHRALNSRVCDLLDTIVDIEGLLV